MPTQAEIDAYNNDGAVCLRGVISPEWIERLRDGVAADMAAPGPMSRSTRRTRTPASSSTISTSGATCRR